ncbi:MAG: M20 family metallopeptidase [Patescibacteria group bacterium]
MTETNTAALIATAQETQQYVVGIRQHLHQYPEVRWEEEKTLIYIRHQIGQLLADIAGFDAKAHVVELKGGLVVDVNINPSFDRILLRSDVDALPGIQEATGLPFASKISGKMHACGHDTHAAMLLGALKAIAEGKVQPKHNLRFVFQRAEENPLTESGGASLVKEGVLNGISEAHALHIWADGKAGSFIGKAGNFTANSDRVKVTIKCNGGHVAFPENGTSAVDIGADIVVAMRGLAVRTIGPNRPVSLAPAVFQSGEGSNVLPAGAELWFACRNYLLPAERSKFHATVKKHIETVATQYADAVVTVEVINGHPVMANSQGAYDETLQLLQAAGQTTETMEPSLGGEDFAWYSQSQGGVPSSMWMLGANQPGCGGHHKSTFNPDESVFWKGVLFWLLIATK